MRLTAVAAFSPRDVWAVGDAHEADAPGYRGHGVVLHWNGGAWTHGPTLYDASGLFSVAASPPRDLWVAGVDAFRFATEGGEGAFVARRRARWNVTPLEKRLVRGLGVQPDGTIIGVGFAGSGIDEVGNGFPIRTRPLVLRSTC